MCVYVYVCICGCACVCMCQPESCHYLARGCFMVVCVGVGEDCNVTVVVRYQKYILCPPFPQKMRSRPEYW
mgnify:CR=1 FL=1